MPRQIHLYYCIIPNTLLSTKSNKQRYIITLRIPKLLLLKKSFFSSNYIIMVKLTKHKLDQIAKNRSINNYLYMSREELLSSLDEYDRIIKNLSENGLEKIVKMQNLSLNELEKIERMNNLSLNELNQIAIARNIKNYMNMSREDLLIALLKSNQSHTEIRKSNYSNKEIEETKKIFNELRNNFSK